MGKREEVLAEARSFMHTPYHSGGMLKNVGVDCGTFIYLVYHNVGVFPEAEIGVFSQDWFANTTEERYLNKLVRHASKYAEGIGAETKLARPGDIALVQTPLSHVYNHAGIVTCWPFVIHQARYGVQECNIFQHPLWAFRKIAILNPFGDGGDLC